MYQITDKDGKVLAEALTIEKAIALMELWIDSEEELRICKTED